MKKIFSFLMILMLGFSSFSNVIASDSSSLQEPTKMTKSGQPDKRYNANKHLKKDGTSDMRYNTSKKAAVKKTTVKKTATSSEMKKAA
jgi:hypothetical protein